MTDRPTTEEGRPDAASAFWRAVESYGGYVEVDNVARFSDHLRAALAAPPSEQEEPPVHVHDPVRLVRWTNAVCITCGYAPIPLAEGRWLTEGEWAEATRVRAASTPVPALRHHPNDNCGDPEHDAILEAWYARAEALLDRAPVPALDPTRLKQAFHNHDTTHNGGCGWWCSDDIAAEYLRLSGDEGGAGES